MMSVLNETYASGVDRVVKVPVTINGRYDLGELRSTVKSCLQDGAGSARLTEHSAVAQRAYELDEAGGRHEGSNLQHWLKAERDVAMRCLNGSPALPYKKGFTSTPAHCS